jgi:uncharacterized membrane protein YfcA
MMIDPGAMTVLAWLLLIAAVPMILIGKHISKGENPKGSNHFAATTAPFVAFAADYAWYPIHTVSAVIHLIVVVACITSTYIAWYQGTLWSKRLPWVALAWAYVGQIYFVGPRLLLVIGTVVIAATAVIIVKVVRKRRKPVKTSETCEGAGFIGDFATTIDA